MNPTKLTTIKQDAADKALATARHAELLAHDDYIADTVLSATSSLIKYLEGHTTKTEVINQLESIATPDVEHVVKALEVIDRTLQNHENVDITPLTSLLEQLVSETKSIPKDHKDIVIPETFEIKNQVDNKKELKDILTAVKAIKLIAEAPVVNVPETKVNVEAPDLKPITKATESLEKTVKLGHEEMREASSKSASALITEPFDEYKVMYSVPFDDEEPVITGIKYYLKGRLSTTLKYTYDKKGNLTGGKRV